MNREDRREMSNIYRKGGTKGQMGDGRRHMREWDYCYARYATKWAKKGMRTGKEAPRKAIDYRSRICRGREAGASPPNQRKNGTIHE